MATTVLQVGGVPPSIADVLALKYEALVLRSTMRLTICRHLAVSARSGAEEAAQLR